MLKNMFEQEHKSTALDLSADEVLNARLGKGARVKSHTAAIVATAAAAILAVGIGVYALNSNLETADPEFTATNSSQAETTTTTTKSTDGSSSGAETTTVTEDGASKGTDGSSDDPDNAKVTTSVVKYQTTPKTEETYGDDIQIALLNNAGVTCEYDITDSDILSRLWAYADDFIKKPYSDYKASDVDMASFNDCKITFRDKKNDRAFLLRMNSSNVIEIHFALGDEQSDDYYIDGSKNKELYDIIAECKEAGSKKLDEQNRVNPYNLSIYIYNEGDYITNVDLDKCGIDYSDVTSNIEAFYNAYKAGELPEDVDVSEEEDWDPYDNNHVVAISIGNAKLRFDIGSEENATLYMLETVYDGATYKSMSGYSISDNAEIYKYLKDMWNKVGNKNKTPDEKTVTSDEDTTTTTTQQTTKKTTTKKTITTKTANNTAKKTSKVTTVSWTPDMKYSSDEIKPLNDNSSVVLDIAEYTTIVHFGRTVAPRYPQSSMNFELIDEYEELIKEGVYESYKSGEIKPTSNVPENEDVKNLVGGTTMSVYWYDKSDGGLVCFVGGDLGNDGTYIKLTDYDDRDDDDPAGNVFYFDKQSAVYKQMKAIWDFYYPVYESVK